MSDYESLKDFEEDVKKIDWLSDRVAYIMLVNPQTKVMYSLPNEGNGWKGNELRKAINKEMKK